MNRRALRILVWHRFPNTRPLRDALDAQCAHLKRHYRPISLSDAAWRLREGERLPPHAVALTVDDGYRDFLTTAFPLFYKYRLPVTLFLACDFVDRRAWMWGDYIRYAIEHAAVSAAEIGGVKLNLRSREERGRAVDYLKDRAKRMPNDERLQLLGRLPDMLRVAIPDRPPQTDAPLGWKEIRDLAASGLIELGAHTVTHPILSRLAGPSEIEAEIAGSKARIERELGMRVAHFCYPNGTADDIPAGVGKIVSAAGFETAVTMLPGLNFAGADLFLLKRIAVNTDYPQTYFEQIAAGLRV